MGHVVIKELVPVWGTMAVTVSGVLHRSVQQVLS